MRMAVAGCVGSLLLGGAILLPESSSAEDQAPRGAAALVGVWQCVQATIDGRPLAAEAARALRLTLTADRFRTERDGQVLFDSAYLVNQQANPPQIDMKGTEGPLQGQSAPGIFRLEGDRLTLCYVMPGGERPKSFESAPQSGAYLIIWERLKQP